MSGPAADELPHKVFWRDDAVVRKWAERLGVGEIALRDALIAVGPDMERAIELLKVHGEQSGQ
jgi:hypothetical protein